ncbi:MAG TPA: hypothetical protein VM553_21325 [Dongiaceae bacterium]|nr:hypothetical protein [Dongiaceae bacterium]
MNRFKIAALVVTTLALCACGGGSKGHGNRGGPDAPMSGTPSTEEFGDLVTRLIRQQADTLEPEDINPNRWSFQVNENEAAFNHLF